MESKKSKAVKAENHDHIRSEEPSVIVHKRSWAWPLATVLIFFGLVFIAAVIAVAIWGNRYGHSWMMDNTYSRGWMMERSGFWGDSLRSHNRAAGVVTAVSTNSFTIAGNGATTNVTASNSTQYQGGNQVKVNDTVIVYGNTSGNTLQATFIVINP